MNKSTPIENAADIFKKIFGDTVQFTNIDEITKGSVEIDNYDKCIHVQDTKMKDMPNELSTVIKNCTLKPYDYQIDTVKMIRQIELEWSNTNAVLVKLPIGSGKSLVYELLTIAFPTVPQKPIITSVNGVSIELDNQLSVAKYPFFYEKPYYEDDDPVVVGLDKYRQLPVTVILTHNHLLDQTLRYFYEDFPVIKRNDEIYNKFQTTLTRIIGLSRNRLTPAQAVPYVLKECGLKNEPKLTISVSSSFERLNRNAKIWITVANVENVNKLRIMSHSTPFTRLIIDDFTSMIELGSFRQIYATSNIFVSGSGWNRDAKSIPISYYSLQGFNDSNITLVDDPARTMKGIRRDSILSLTLETSDNSFNEYAFVSEIETEVNNLFDGKNPRDVYGPIKTNPRLSEYLSLKFLLNFSQILGYNYDKIVDDTESGRLSKDRVKYTLQLIDMLKSKSRPLWEKLMNDGKIQSKNNQVRPIVSDNSCIICKATPDTHHSYGVLMRCCGGFVCQKCIDKSTTNRIHYDNETHYSKEYYCACCQSENPTMIMCTTKDISDDRKVITAVIKNTCNVSELHDSISIDYYAYGILKGFIPLNHNGRIITKVGKNNKPLLMQSRAQLGMIALNTACKSFVDNNIKTSIDSNILIYGAPKELIDRIRGYYNNVIKNQVFGKLPCPMLMFKDGVKDLIGLHSNIPIIIKWAPVKNVDELHQLIGRIVRLSNFDNRLYVYADLAPDNENSYSIN